jgi:hypothetical protein
VKIVSHVVPAPDCERPKPPPKTMPANRPFGSVGSLLSAHLALAAVLIVVHTIVWTAASEMMRWPGAPWDDMLEAYSWAQHWQLG